MSGMATSSVRAAPPGGYGLSEGQSLRALRNGELGQRRVRGAREAAGGARGGVLLQFAAPARNAVAPYVFHAAGGVADDEVAAARHLERSGDGAYPVPRAARANLKPVRSEEVGYLTLRAVACEAEDVAVALDGIRQLLRRLPPVGELDPLVAIGVAEDLAHLVRNGLEKAPRNPVKDPASRLEDRIDEGLRVGVPKRIQVVVPERSGLIRAVQDPKPEGRCWDLRRVLVIGERPRGPLPSGCDMPPELARADASDRLRVRVGDPFGRAEEGYVRAHFAPAGQGLAKRGASARGTRMRKTCEAPSAAPIAVQTSETYSLSEPFSTSAHTASATSSTVFAACFSPGVHARTRYTPAVSYTH